MEDYKRFVKIDIDLYDMVIPQEVEMIIRPENIKESYWIGIPQLDCVKVIYEFYTKEDRDYYVSNIKPIQAPQAGVANGVDLKGSNIEWNPADHIEDFGQFDYNRLFN